MIFFEKIPGAEAPGKYGRKIRLFVLVFELGSRNNDAGESQQRDDVGDHHDVVEHIRQLPYQIVGEERAEEDERDSDNGVDQRCLLAEEVLYVLLAEEVPADDGSECEEGKADGYENVADLLAAKCLTYGILHHIGFCDEAGACLGEKSFGS